MKKVYSLTELNHTLQGILASQMGVIRVEGEISNFSSPASGHYYFTLKDNKAQIRCVMFKSKNRFLDKKPANGDKVLLRATPSIYEARGDLQLIVDHIEATGLGLLLLKLEQLKQKIQKRGWFDSIHKHSIPVFPKNIGIITSATGAAIQDALNVIKRRAPASHIFIYPTLVQGNEAAENIRQAIETMDKRKECDACLLIRGGGSIEDLWSFNEEIVLQAIHDAKTPIVCGIGHETDNTLAELVADAYAPTPSAAAEIITAGYPLLEKSVRHLNHQMLTSIHNYLNKLEYRKRYLLQKLNTQHPLARLQQLIQKCDHLQQALPANIQHLLNNKKTLTAYAGNRLTHIRLDLKLNMMQQKLRQKSHNLSETILQIYNLKLSRYQKNQGKLNTLDPKATLKRGYTITRDNKNKIIRNISDLKEKDLIKTTFYDGFSYSTINKLKKYS